MSTRALDDLLFDDVRQALETPSPTGLRIRKALGGVELSTLLIWNVLVASLVHLACHLLGDVISHRLRGLHQRFESGDTVASEEAGKLVAETAAILEGIVVAPARIQHEETEEVIRRILMRAGWPAGIADERAKAIVHVLSSRLGGDGGEI